ncbi:hypothetical protein QYF36_023792 [Acer negundo]|nr:hypothetical protein QYF36_023792 [Acer negundo]
MTLANWLSDHASCSYGPLTWWSLKLPSKIRIFCWKACREILPTRLLLCKRGLVESDLCPFYGVESESVDHALWRYTIPHWRSWSIFLDINKLRSSCFLDRVLWLSSIGNEEVMFRFLIIAWLFWFRRNLLLHGGTVIVHDNYWAWAGEMLKMFENYGKLESSSKDGKTVTNVWSLSPSGYFKLNTYVVMDLDKGRFGVDVFIRDDNGVIVLAATLS